MQKIFKIRVPSAHIEFSYSVGQEIKANKYVYIVTEIERDTNSFYLFGSLSYIIWVKKKGASEDVLKYRVFEGLPVDITYEI